jgi:hypothetical protein
MKITKENKKKSKPTPLLGRPANGIRPRQLTASAASFGLPPALIRGTRGQRDSKEAEVVCSGELQLIDGGRSGETKCTSVTSISR